MMLLKAWTMNEKVNDFILSWSKPSRGKVFLIPTAQKSTKKGVFSVPVPIVKPTLGPEL